MVSEMVLLSVYDVPERAIFDTQVDKIAKETYYWSYNDVINATWPVCVCCKFFFIFD
jgi:hypothetical protein